MDDQHQRRRRVPARWTSDHDATRCSETIRVTIFFSMGQARVTPETRLADEESM